MLATNAIKIAPRSVTIDAKLKEAIDLAITRVEDFHRAQLANASPKPGPQGRVFSAPTYRAGSLTPASANPFNRSKQASHAPHASPAGEGS